MQQSAYLPWDVFRAGIKFIIMNKNFCCRLPAIILVLLFLNQTLLAQDSSQVRKEKILRNTVRYNLSNALLFGFDKFLVLGYERVIGKKQSFSINVGKASLPKLVSIVTDSFSLQKDSKNSGFNLSVDYRFYLAKENKYAAPRGIYIGPYYAYNHFTRESEWSSNTNSTVNKQVTTNSKLDIHTFGFELGYQFVFWNRLSLDLILVGPGLGIYNYKATMEGNLDAEDQQQLREALHQLLTQKFPGMNFVFSDKQIDADGVMNTTTIGYRYLIQIGFRF